MRLWLAGRGRVSSAPGLPSLCGCPVFVGRPILVEVSSYSAPLLKDSRRHAAIERRSHQDRHALNQRLPIDERHTRHTDALVFWRSVNFWHAFLFWIAVVERRASPLGVSGQCRLASELWVTPRPGHACDSRVSDLQWHALIQWMSIRHRHAIPTRVSVSCWHAVNTGVTEDTRLALPVRSSPCRRLASQTRSRRR